MKKVMALAIFVLGLLSQTFAQSQSKVIQKTFSVDKDEKVELNLRFGDSISIESWDKNEVVFQAIVEVNGGKLNDAVVFDYNQKSGRLEIDSDFDKVKMKAGRLEDCPDVYAKYNDPGSHVVCSNIWYQIVVPRNVDLKVESISGDIELIGLRGPIRAKSISGFVDLSWPSGNGAVIDIKTISGEAYTNMDNLQFDNKKDHIPLVGYELKGRIGQNGPRVSLESVSGNIYLRESNS